MNRKLLFITLLCINAHNYGAQQNDPPQIAPLNTDQVDFIRAQERVLTPIRFFLLPSLEDSQEGIGNPKSRFLRIIGAPSLISAGICSLLVKPNLDLVLATGILGGLTGVLIEQARKKTPAEQLEERKRSARENLIKQGNVLCNSHDLMILAFPYFLHNNPHGFKYMENCFTSHFTSCENPYGMLKAEKEIVNFIEIIRKFQEKLPTLTGTLGEIDNNLERYFKLPLADNLLHLRKSPAYYNEQVAQYRNAALENLKRQ